MQEPEPLLLLAGVSIGTNNNKTNNTMSEMNTNVVPNSVYSENVLSGLRGAYQWGAPVYSENVLSDLRGAYLWGSRVFIYGLWDV